MEIKEILKIVDEIYNKIKFGKWSSVTVTSVDYNGPISLLAACQNVFLHMQKQSPIKRRQLCKNRYSVPT